MSKREYDKLMIKIKELERFKNEQNIVCEVDKIGLLGKYTTTYYIKNKIILKKIEDLKKHKQEVKELKSMSIWQFIKWRKS